MNISKLKAWEMREKLLDGEISSEDIIKSHIEAIKEKEDSINAFINFNEEYALEEARKIDEKIKNGEKLGVLAGLPIAIKDNISTIDFKTTAGSKMLENYQPSFDAHVVEKIKENDGIIIGKANMDEFSMGRTTETSFFGPTKNPLDLSRIPGGSSGGSAASVAASEAALSIGSDTGGSIRKPASHCGVVGIKPTYGIVSRFGLIALSNTLDAVGVFGKDVRDAVLMLEAIYGKDESDTTSVKVDLDFNTEKGIEGLKIGIPKEWLELQMDSRVREDFEASVEKFKEAGAIVEEVSIPNIVHTKEVYKIIVSSDASSNMSRYDGIQYGYRAEDYNTLDELYMHSRGEGFGEEVKRRILFGTYLLVGDRGNKYYKKAQKVRTMLIDDFKDAFSGVDLLIAPSDSNLPRKFDEDRDSYKDYNESINLAGLPSMSIPMGGKDLKTGLQIIGDRFSEETIINAGKVFEGMVK